MNDIEDRPLRRRRIPFLGLGRRNVDAAEPDPKPENGQPVPPNLRFKLAEFEQARVADVMVPRADMVAVELSTSLPDLIQLYADEAHSRLPVYRESLDDPVGFVHIKDVVGEVARGGEGLDRPLERLRRDILFVPASMRLSDLLVKMQTTRIHMALVVDEYGGTDGLVSLEDLMEEIVGDIEDEHDETTALVRRRGRQAWEADARVEVSEFEQKSGFDLSLPDMDVAVDTLGGVAFALAGRVPLRGEVLRHPAGLDIEIVDAEPRRIHRMIVRALPRDVAA